MQTLYVVVAVAVAVAVAHAEVDGHDPKAVEGMKGLRCQRRLHRGGDGRTGLSTGSGAGDAGGSEGGSGGKGIVAHGLSGSRNCHRLHS